MFRSDDMQLLLFYFNKDTAKACLQELGYAKLVHFVDLNKKKETSEDEKLMVSEMDGEGFNDGFHGNNGNNGNGVNDGGNTNKSSNFNNGVNNTNGNANDKINNGNNTYGNNISGNNKINNNKTNNKTNNNKINKHKHSQKSQENTMLFVDELRRLERINGRLTFLQEEIGRLPNQTSTYLNLDELETIVEKHFTRLVHLKDISKHTVKSLITLAEDLCAMEDLDKYLHYAGAPEFLDECKKNLQYLIVVSPVAVSHLLKRVLMMKLRRNIIVEQFCHSGTLRFDFDQAESNSFNKCNGFDNGFDNSFNGYSNNSGNGRDHKNTNNKTNLPEPENQGQAHSFHVYLIFTHGERAITKTKQIVESLNCRWLDPAVIEKGRLKLTALKNEIMRVYANNTIRLYEQVQIIKSNMDIWVRNHVRELRICQVLAKLRQEKGRNLLVGQGFVRSDDLSLVRSICGYAGLKGIFVGIEIVKNYGKELSESNDVVVEMSNDMELRYENKDRLEYLNGNVDSCVTDNYALSAVSSQHVDRSSLSNEETSKSKSITSKNTLGKSTTIPSFSLNKKETSIQHKRNINQNINQSYNQNINQNINQTFNQSYNQNYNNIDTMNIPEIKIPDHPPTHFNTTPLTQSFQNITNVYGIPAYHEINPAIFYITTFPFMFGCMFGDLGHGLILLFLSLYMIRNESRLVVPDFLKMIFQGRYIMLLCSLWACFFGLIYSDFMSLPIPLFPSAYTGSKKASGYTYLLGVDHAWHHSEKSGMLFMNSLKMKLSIIIGFFHMALGSILALMNIVNRKDKLYCYCVWIPQTLAFFSFVGYIIFLIFFKWLVTFDHPSLISVLVNMYTSPFEVDGCFRGQKEVQLLLLSCIVISLPWMLLSKPVYETVHAKRKVEEEVKVEGRVFFGLDKGELNFNVNDNDNVNAITNQDNKNKQNSNNAMYEEHSPTLPEIRLNSKKPRKPNDQTLVDIWMHQCIDTIEFGIGLISNTSSYLRLWAISLAHSQLTSVLHSMTIGNKSVLVKLISFPIWLFFTVALLVGLEGLSACLHALRLNWIEFNGKFYKGGGYLFEPLNFEIPEED